VNPITRIASAIGLLGALATSPLFAQRTTTEEIERYRAAVGDGNPAELWEVRGEALWAEKRGPKNASLERCDLGVGPGVVKGAYTVLPKYFSETDKVEDLESRLVTCMVRLQGFTPEQAKKDPFAEPGTKVSMDALVAYIAGQSRGMKMNVSLNHPKEKEAYAIGEKIFHFRGGTHDFACTSCHGADNQRIRLQDLPNLGKPEDAQKAYVGWPGYRLTQGEVRSMQWRLYECFRQQRFPELEFVSPASIALTTYLARNANGGVMIAPSVKR